MTATLPYILAHAEQLSLRPANGAQAVIPRPSCHRAPQATTYDAWGPGAWGLIPGW
eukprot:COSAG01_NODE_1280_length_10925_cov_23.969333_7_plen_56_part_00